MARYHFHAVDNKISLNLLVEELADDDAAFEQAQTLASSLLKSDPETYAQNPDVWEIRVTDSDGSEVLALPFSELPDKNPSE